MTETVAQPSVSAPPSVDRLDHTGWQSDGRVRISFGAAVLMTLTGSVVTAIWVRRRQRARARKLALAMVILKLGSAALGSRARHIAPLGGAGGSVLLASLLMSRLRQSRAQPEVPSGDFSRRLGALLALREARVASDRPHPRDILLGVAMGLGIAGALSRASSAGQKAVS